MPARLAMPVSYRVDIARSGEWRTSALGTACTFVQRKRPDRGEAMGSDVIQPRARHRHRCRRGRWWRCPPACTVRPIPMGPNVKEEAPWSSSCFG